MEVNKLRVAFTAALSFLFFMEDLKVLINDKQDIELKDVLKQLVDEVVKEKVEIEFTITPDNQNLIVRPWQPFSYNCPYKE